MTENADLLAYRLRIAQEKLKKAPRTKRMTRRNALAGVAKAHLDLLNATKKKP
jgi:hypothetical protein